MGEKRFVILLITALAIGNICGELIKREQYLYGLGVFLFGTSAVTIITVHTKQ
jgi:hypothetical protein